MEPRVIRADPEIGPEHRIRSQMVLQRQRRRQMLHAADADAIVDALVPPGAQDQFDRDFRREAGAEIEFINSTLAVERDADPSYRLAIGRQLI